MTSPSADDDFSAIAIRWLVDEFLGEKPQWQEWQGDRATILDIGDLEDHMVIAVRKGVVTFETISRDHRYISAEFSRARDAWRFLIMQLGGSYRFARRLPDINPKELAPGTSLAPAPSGHRLTWPGGEATFYRDLDAVGFSWVSMAEPADIAASYRHFNGEPLFDLGIESEPRPPQPPRPRRVMAPLPVESPPPDYLDPADLAVIDEIAARLNWARRPPVGAEVLSLGDDQVGRAISYRQSQFVYEHTVSEDWRSAVGTFSTAAAARRFMIAELGFILRQRTRMPRIRPRRVGPDCAIEKGPTSFLVTSPAGQGNFNIGYNGHQNALTFGWVATASLADIAASYQHPNGEPIFDLDDARAFHQPPKPSAKVGALKPQPGGSDAAIVVTQEADTELLADLAVIDELLAESLLWSRRPGFDPLVFEVADFDAEWVLTRGGSGHDAEYRRQRGRTVYGRFSSARGARRFVVMDLGRRWRESHPVKSIWHKRLAPGTELHETADGYRLTWPSGEARFVHDYDAVNFSWIATAELADIVASFTHPNGEPLFDLNRPPQPPAA
jgi:hypothetical protein